MVVENSAVGICQAETPLQASILGGQGSSLSGFVIDERAVVQGFKYYMCIRSQTVNSLNQEVCWVFIFYYLY